MRCDGLGGMFLILVGIVALAGIIEINDRHALDLGGMAWRHHSRSDRPDC